MDYEKTNYYNISSIFFRIGYSQLDNSDDIIHLFQQALKNNPTQFVADFEKNFAMLDSNIQTSILNYLYTYKQDYLLYLNINKLHQILEIFYTSNYPQIRQRATNLILETYRLTHGATSIGWVWYNKAKLLDFNKEAKAIIIKILKSEQLSDVELNLQCNYEFYTSQNFYKNDTLFIRDYRKNTRLSLDELRDSIAKAEAMNNIKNITHQSIWRV